MTGKEFRDTYMKPIVYTWKRGDSYLYIGGSGRGIGRMISDTHKVIHPLNILDDDEMLIDYFDTKRDALRAERSWIRSYHPRYNSKQGRADTYEQLRVEALRRAELPSYQTGMEAEDVETNWSA